MKSMLTLCAGLWLAGAAGLPAQAQQAQAVANFYKGKTVNVLIGVGVGGEYDLQARLVARHIGKYIPGNPLVVPQNMTGAGGIKMANFLYTLAARDGTNIGMLGNNFPATQAVGGQGVQFDSVKFNWLGSIAAVNETMAVWTSTGVTTIDDLRRQPIIAARDDVATVRAAMGAGLPVAHELLAGQDPGQWQPGGDALGHDQDVRLDAPVLDGEHLAGPPEAGLDLVGDEQDPVLAGDLAEARQEPGRWHDVTALAEDRLDDDRGHPVGVDELVEGQVELGLPVAGAGIGRVGATRRPIAIRVGGVVDAAGQRLEMAPINVLRGGEGHRLARPAVIAVTEAEDDRPAGRDPGELDRRLDRLGAAV